MNKLKTILFTVPVLIVLCAPVLAKPIQVNGIAAIVNNDVITELDLNKSANIRAIATGEKKSQELRQIVLNNLINDTLFGQLVAKKDINVTEDEVARSIAGVLHENRMTINSLKRELNSKGITYEQYKTDIKNQLKRAKFINQQIGPRVKITDQDLRDYFQKNQEKFRGFHSAHISQLIIPLTGIQTQEQFEKLRATALEIVAKARKGQKLETLAKNYSKGQTVVDAVDMGMMDIKNMNNLISSVVKTMEVGQVSNPMLIEQALVIVKLISLPELSSEDFDKLRDDIYQAMYDKAIEVAMNSYLLSERQKAYVEIRN